MLKLNTQSAEKFIVFRRPLESGRQSPANLAGNMILGSFLLAFMVAMEYFFAVSGTAHPWQEEILAAHTWFTGILIGLSLILTIPKIYKKAEKLQYFVSILVSQNLFGLSIYIWALLLISEEGNGMSAESILEVTRWTLAVGAIVLVLTFVRLIVRIKRGKYRVGSAQDESRSSFEYKSHLPAAIAGGSGLFFILRYLITHSNYIGADKLLIIFFGIFLFYVMLFILPEQLVILYCKFRFKSFNYYTK